MNLLLLNMEGIQNRDDFKKHFDEVIKSIRMDLNKLSFDVENFKVLLNGFYPKYLK